MLLCKEVCNQISSSDTLHIVHSYSPPFKLSIPTPLMSEIQVISSCLVPMATNSATPTMDLTPWDLQFLLLDPIQKGILFHKPDSQEFNKDLINHLKISFACTLDYFPPLSGRLGTINNDDKTVSYFINCNNAGAEFTHAVARALSVSDILSPTYIPGILSSLFPLNETPNYDGVLKPLFGVQVTELVDGYFVACTANHAVVDGTSFWHFFNSWSEISRGFETISKLPVFERWFPFSSNASKYNIHLPPLEQNLLGKKTTSPPLLERVFHFSRESVAKLKSRANSECGSEKISSFQALSAHLWRSVVRCKNSQNGVHGLSMEGEEIYFSLIVSARQRIPLPEGYFGDTVYFARSGINAGDLLKNGLGFAALKINEWVAQHTREAAIGFVEDWMKNPVIVKRGTFSFAVSSSPRHNVYGTDFGWGKPIAVRSGNAQKFDGKMTAYPAAVAGGIDVEVCLAPETLQALEADAEFMEAASMINCQ